MVLTTLMLATVKQAVLDSVESDHTYGAIGTSATAPASSQTALQGTEVDRNARTSVTENGTAVTIPFTFASTEGNGNTIQEFGVFNASSGGTMKGRWTHTAVAKTSSIEIRYQVVITPTVSEI